MTASNTLQNQEVAVLANWARLGVLFNVNAAGQTPDVERLLLDTARLVGGNSRLFTAAGTWLHHHGQYVAGHRLAQLVRDELEPEHWATLGLLLEWACGRHAHLKVAIRACEEKRSAVAPTPLSNVERQSPTLTRMAEERATEPSRRWGRWTDGTTLCIRREILRDVEWVTRQNPLLALREFLTDAAASILASFSPGTVVESMAIVATRAGLDRLSTTKSLSKLRNAGFVRFLKEGRRTAIEFVKWPAETTASPMVA